LPTASVDVAFVCATYHHFGHVREMVTDIHRALRPGGRLVIIDYKRIPGVSSAWILKHVRWGQKKVIKQVTKYGFRLEKRIKVDGLKENYVMTFKRVKKK
jgi:predicted methyltransferase